MASLVNPLLSGFPLRRPICNKLQHFHMATPKLQMTTAIAQKLAQRATHCFN